MTAISEGPWYSKVDVIANGLLCVCLLSLHGSKHLAAEHSGYQAYERSITSALGLLVLMSNWLASLPEGQHRRVVVHADVLTKAVCYPDLYDRPTQTYFCLPTATQARCCYGVDMSLLSRRAERLKIKRVLQSLHQIRNGCPEMAR